MSADEQPSLFADAPEPVRPAEFAPEPGAPLAAWDRAFRPHDYVVLAEQVVRSGWQVPIPFSLRVPKEIPLAGRKLQITARFVNARQPLFALAGLWEWWQDAGKVKYVDRSKNNKRPDTNAPHDFSKASAPKNAEHDREECEGEDSNTAA